MQGIQPTSLQLGAGSNLIQPATAGSLGSAQSANANSVSITSSSSVTTAVLVQQQVDGMLSGIDPALANNDYLKLLIVAMILNALLGDDISLQQSAQNSLQALEGLTGGTQNTLYFMMETSTNTVQIQQSSQRLDTVQAVQLLTQPGQAGTGQGNQLDLSA